MADGPARLADADDAAEVTRLRVEMLRELTGHDATGSADESAGVLSDAISSGDWLGCSVVDGDVGLLSCGIVYLDRRLGAAGVFVQAHIGSMYTDPAHRRRGYGRDVLQSLLTWAAARGATKAHLFASELGRPLYEAEGFYVGGPLWQRKLRPPGTREG